MPAYCPKCGAEMTGGICNNCGFPLTKIRGRVFDNNVRGEGR